MSTILTVDDCSMTTSLICRSLRADGHDMVEAHSGCNALEIMGSQDVDLALVDLVMPGMSGSELIAEMRQVKPDLPIVVVSGLADLDTVVRIMKLGVQDYIQKPIDWDRLRSAVKAALAVGCAPVVMEPTIGPCRVKYSLGEGQAGIVFEVERDDKRYAMKILRMSHDREQAEMRRMRFEREVGLLRQLDHPNIVHVYDSGICENSGQAYMVMELIEGNTLSHLMQTTADALCIEAKMVLCRGLLEGLVHLEENHVLHRDIKLANIMLNESQQPVLVDFGLVRLMHSSLTNTFAFLGTPAYLAPEAFLNEPLTARSDQFSLGCVAYELLFSSRPFRAETVPQLCSEIVYNEPAPPEIQVQETWLPVFDILRVAMAKDPELRCPAASEFLEDWDACLDHTAPVHAQRRLDAVLEANPQQNRLAKEDYRIDDARIAVRPFSSLDTQAETWCNVREEQVFPATQ